MSRLSLPNLSITKWIILLLAVTTAIVVAWVSTVDADHHVHATVNNNLGSMRSGPGYEFSVIQRLNETQQVNLTARNETTSWMRVESNGNVGWTPTNALQVHGAIEHLPVDNTPLPNAQIYPTAKTFQNLVGVRSGADWNYAVQATLWADLEVIVMARSAQHEWLYIYHELGQGYVPRSSLIVEFDVQTLPVWNSPQQGAELSLAADTGADGNTVAGVPEEDIYRGDPEPDTERPTASVLTQHAAVSTGPGIAFDIIGELNQRDRPIVQARDETNQFVFVWTYRVDGWVRESNLQLSVDINTLPVWTRPMHSAEEIVTGRVAVANLNQRMAPNTDGEILGQLLEGQRISVIGRNEASTWIYVSSNLGTGWVYEPLVSLTQDVESIPVR